MQFSFDSNFRAVLFTISLLLIATTSGGAQDMPKDWQLALERTGCFGDCPRYKIVIEASGAVTFRNRDGETEKGELSAEQIRKLFEISETSKFLSLEAKYRSEQECDGPPATDFPSEVISISSQGRSRTVTHNEGCKPKPNTFLIKVVKLAEAIDSVTNGMFIKR